MITFVTLFLGLALGPQNVEVAVDPNVVRVELLLDSQSIGTLQPPTWRGLAPLGNELIPRELEAVAFDAEGKEVGRVAQRLNVPRKAAEVTVSFDSDGTGDRWARLSWENSVGDRPTAIRVFLDGEPVGVENPKRVVLPPLNDQQLHVFRAEVDFPKQISASLDTTFGGSYSEAVSSELTAIPILVEKNSETPTLDALSGAFRVRGKAARVAAIEQGQADFVFVLDRSAVDESEDLARKTTFGFLTDRVRYALDLGAGHRGQIFWPASFHVEGENYNREIFGSKIFRTGTHGILVELGRGSRPSYSLTRQRLADAVAVAGLAAAERNRRRAVVLLLGNDPQDSSLYQAEQVRGALAALDVPFEVWCLEKEGLEAARKAWGNVVDTTTIPKIRKAGVRLRKAVESQRIVWLQGSYLPNHVEFSASDPGILRAGKGRVHP